LNRKGRKGRKENLKTFEFKPLFNVGEVETDEEGMKTMADPGLNMAWLLRKLRG